MLQALDEYVVLGPQTNLSFLRAIITHPAFAAGDLSTDFLQEHLAAWHRRQPTTAIVAIAALLSDAAPPAGPGRTPVGPRFADPWDRLREWRMA
jgi:acetyl/propionyl-CoA carboxylase alpha subunit